jgi:hypothetical protein
MPADLTDAARHLVARTTSAQGLPRQLSDAAVAEQVAQLLRTGATRVLNGSKKPRDQLVDPGLTNGTRKQRRKRAA